MRKLVEMILEAPFSLNVQWRSDFQISDYLSYGLIYAFVWFPVTPSSQICGNTVCSMVKEKWSWIIFRMTSNQEYTEFFKKIMKTVCNAFLKIKN